MKRIIISAMSHDRVIGTGTGLPWHIPEEYPHFLDCVRGNVMLMGRKSWEIFGGDVVTAANIIITGSAEFANAQSAAGIAEALALAASYQRPIFIAGGATIYTQALDADVVDEMWLSYIPGTFAGETRFPEFSTADWQDQERRAEPRYEFVRWTRREKCPE